MGKPSKERQTLEEQSRKALAGLGVTNEAAVKEIIAETIGHTVAGEAAQERAAPPVPVRPAVSDTMPLPRQETKPSLSPAPGPASPLLKTESTPSAEQVYELSLELLDPSPDQPRMNVEPDAELLENIRVKGVKTPIHVRPRGEGRYEIVAGERRWRACQILGKTTIPALIRHDPSHEAAAEALIDNLLRKDLTGYEEAKGFQKLIAQHGYQKSELAHRLGCDKGRITRALQVLELPEAILDMTLRGPAPLTLSHVQELLPLRSNLVRLQRVAKQAIEGGWSSNRIREEVTRIPRTNQGAQSVRFSAKSQDGPFTLTVRFHPNRANDIHEIEAKLAEVTTRLNRFKEAQG